MERRLTLPVRQQHPLKSRLVIGNIFQGCEFSYIQRRNSFGWSPICLSPAERRPSQPFAGYSCVWPSILKARNVFDRKLSTPSVGTRRQRNSLSLNYPEMFLFFECFNFIIYFWIGMLSEHSYLTLRLLLMRSFVWVASLRECGAIPVKMQHTKLLFDNSFYKSTIET